jgi:hypothetical protein
MFSTLITIRTNDCTDVNCGVRVLINARLGGRGSEAGAFRYVATEQGGSHV